MFNLPTGTPALTSRNFKNEEFEIVVDFLDRACNIAYEVIQKAGKKLPDFKAALESEPEFQEKVKTLQAEVNEFALKYPMPGFDDH